MSRQGVFFSKEDVSLLQNEHLTGNFIFFSFPWRFSIITETILGITSPALFIST